MEYHWDKDKATENLRKHKVDFADAVIALEDENALTIEDTDHNEHRFKTLGMGPQLNILYVVHTYRNNNAIRIISARKADRNETKKSIRTARSRAVDQQVCSIPQNDMGVSSILISAPRSLLSRLKMVRQSLQADS